MGLAPRSFHAKNEHNGRQAIVPRRERERNAMMKRRDFLRVSAGGLVAAPLRQDRRRSRPTIRPSRCAGSSAMCRAAPPTSWRA